MFGNLFKKKNKFDDAAKMRFATAIANMLEIQMSLVGAVTIVDAQGRPKRKALGYVYGYIDAFLRANGHDMADMSIGVPITYHVIRKLWPDHLNVCIDVIARNFKSDPLMSVGMMHGGQQYLDYRKPGAAGVPMGLARFMIEGD